ncbi:hypothetical protein [Chitinivorax sp. B]|nr:hypothetical protein [Chitinivorax sp. B]
MPYSATMIGAHVPLNIRMYHAYTPVFALRFIPLVAAHHRP